MGRSKSVLEPSSTGVFFGMIDLLCYDVIQMLTEIIDSSMDVIDEDPNDPNSIKTTIIERQNNGGVTSRGTRSDPSLSSRLLNF